MLPSREVRTKLLDVAEAYARKEIASGQVKNHMLALTASGALGLIPCQWEDEDQKAHMLALLRREFRTRDVVAYVTTSEVWIATAKAGDTRKPSERDDRTEGVFIALAVKGEDHPEVRQFIIERPFDGSPPHLIDYPMPEGVTITGRLTSLLQD